MSNDKDIIPMGKAIAIIISIVGGVVLLIVGGFYFALNTLDNDSTSSVVVQKGESNIESKTDKSGFSDNSVPQNTVHTDNGYINDSIGIGESSNNGFDEPGSAKADSYYEEDADSYSADDFQHDYMVEGYGEIAIRQYLEFEFGTSDGFNIDFSPEDSIRGDNPKYFFSILDPSPRHMMDVYVNFKDSTIEDVNENYIFTFMIDMNE